MKTVIALALTLCCIASTSAIAIETVPVGNAGNPVDPSDGDQSTTGIQHFGAVGYDYRIGKYEVTVGQYAEFLNAVAATDTYALYNDKMATNLSIAGISQSCSPNCTYSVIGSPNHPIAYVSWGDAARFANWLHNGQPTGAEGPGTTETGAYALNGAITDAALMTVTRNPGATWFIPTEDEWYKAAYYQPTAQGGDSDGYWTYPMKTNSQPYSDQPPGATPDNTRAGNFFYNDGLSNGYDNGFAATDTLSFSDTQNYLMDVGAYISAAAYYGTFDQGGSMFEWNEAAVTSESRGLRGGSWGDTVDRLNRMYRTFHPSPTNQYDRVGFRVASFVPEPSTLILAAGIFAPLAAYRRRRG